MSSLRRVIQSIRFKYSGCVRKATSCPICVVLIMLLAAITLLVSVQDHDEGGLSLDKFQPATFHKPPQRTSLQVEETVTKLQTHTAYKNHSSSKRPTESFLIPVPSPKIPLPAIKVRFNGPVLRTRHKTQKMKLVSPKKLKFRDVFNALAHPKPFPEFQSTSLPRSNDHRGRRGLNDWMRANNPRDRDKFLVYSAYWDDRFDHINFVRIMGVMVNKNPPTVFCRLMMADGSAIEAVVARKIMNEHWRLRYASYFFSCEVPKTTSPPLKVLVSLQRNFTYSASLPVHHNKENTASPRGEVAVCVKPFHYYYNRATWLLEFIEFHRTLGVEHFFFYNHTVGSSVDAVLRAYVRQNVVTVLPWNLPVKSQKEIRTEGIFSSLNDCVFRTMYLYTYVIMLDFDEYIIPRDHDTYLEMIHQLEDENKRIRGKPGSFVFRNTFFYLYWENDTTAYGVEPEKPPEWIPYFVTQYKTRRLTASMKTGSRSKYIVVPHRVVEVGNHVVWRHTSGSRAIQVADTMALLHHYRICEFGGFACMKKPSLVDRTATRFAKELLQRVLHQCKIVFTETEGRCPLSPPLGSPW